MQKEISLLRNLQKFDLEIQEIRTRVERLREALDEHYALQEELEESLRLQRERLDETRTLMTNKAIDMKVYEDRLQQSKAKLNQITNAREYNAIEKEQDTLKKTRATIEEEHQRLAESVREYEADVSEKEAKANELRQVIAGEEDAIRQEAERAEGRAKTLEEERNRLKKDLPRPTVARYDFIAKRRPGLVVVPARDGVCTGCNMMLPPQLFNEVQRATKLIQCPSCQRILFHENEQERSEANA